jgi:hypothetical protein
MKKKDLYKHISDFVDNIDKLPKKLQKKAKKTLILTDEELNKLKTKKVSASKKLTKAELGQIKNEIEKGANVLNYNVRDLKQLLASEKYIGSSSLTKQNVYNAVKTLKDANWDSTVANQKEFDFTDLDEDVNDIMVMYSGSDLKKTAAKYGLPKSVYIKGKSKAATKKDIITMLSHYDSMDDTTKEILKPDKQVFNPKLPFSVDLTTLDFGVDVVGKNKKKKTRNTYNKDQLVEFAKIVGIQTGGKNVQTLFKEIKKLGKVITIEEPDIEAALEKYRKYFVDEAGFLKKDIKHTVTIKGKKTKRNIPVKSKNNNITLRKIASELGIKKHSSLNKKSLIRKIQKLYKNESKNIEEHPMSKITELISSLDSNQYDLLAAAFKSNLTQKQVLNNLGEHVKKYKTKKLSPKSPKKMSPKKSPKVSPKKSPKVSPKKSPKVSPKKSPKKSPKVSPKKSPKVSPKKSPKKMSPKKSPKKTIKDVNDDLTIEEKEMLLYKSKCMAVSVKEMKSLAKKLQIEVRNKKEDICEDLMLGYFELRLAEELDSKTAKDIMIAKNKKELDKIINKGLNINGVSNVIEEYFDEVDKKEYADIILNLESELDDTKMEKEAMSVTPSPETPQPENEEEKRYMEEVGEEEDEDYEPNEEDEKESLENLSENEEIVEEDEVDEKESLENLSESEEIVEEDEVDEDEVNEALDTIQNVFG